MRVRRDISRADKGNYSRVISRTVFELSRIPAAVLLCTVIVGQVKGIEVTLNAEQVVILVLLALLYGYRLAIRDAKNRQI